jgi:hypothetical protein
MYLRTLKVMLPPFDIVLYRIKLRHYVPYKVVLLYSNIIIIRSFNG